MSFVQSIQNVFRNYAVFTGRATRPEFWWFILFTTLVQMAANALNVVTPNGTVFLGSSLAGLWSIAVLLPTLAVAVRRLRDAGRRWTELFWLLLPIAGLIVLIVHLCDPTAHVAESTLGGGYPQGPQATQA
jgi:uncharacterized membrane protein YhaH (DUF805 family)